MFSSSILPPPPPGMRRYVLCEDGEHPDLFPEETIDFQMSNVTVAFNPIQALGRGNLFITSRRVIWIKDEVAVDGDAEKEPQQVAIDLDVPFIVLHAITRDQDSYPLPCVYCQLSDGDDYSNLLAADDGDGEEGDEEEEKETPEDELFIVPEDDAALTKIFNALSHAAMMNPDPPEDGEQEGDDEFIYDEDEVALGAEQARVLQHLDSVFVAPTMAQRGAHDEEDDEEEEDEEEDGGQFEDADEC